MKVGDQLPSLRHVTDDDGRMLNWRDARRNRIVFFAHPGECTECSGNARALLELQARLDKWDGDIWIVGDAAIPGVVDVIRVTGDADHRLRQRCGLSPEDATVVIADRWGQVWQVAPTDDRHVVETADVLETTKFIAIQCPECETLDQPTGDWSSVH